MTLEHPAWLVLLLLLPLLATGAALAGQTRARQWAVFVANRLRPKLLHRSSPVPRWIAFTCLLLALGLLVIGLARPVSHHGSEQEEVLGRNVLFAIDLSRSMKAADLKPDRLTQAKTVCFELLEAMPTDRIGVIGFAGTSYLFAPLTIDHGNVRENIGQLDIDWIPTGGSNLAGGLRLAIKTLRETGSHRNALVLLSDGEENVGSITELASEAREAGIEVIAIGFGTPDGEFVPDPQDPSQPFRDRDGVEVISRLEPKALQRLATETGGRFAIASSGADIPAMVQAAIADLERVKVAANRRMVTVEHFQWFLLPAILLLIASIVAATRWRGVGRGTASVVLLSLLVPLAQPVRADALLDARAAMDERRYEDAFGAFGELAARYRDTETGYRMSLAKGEAAYRLGDFPEARQAFSEAMRSNDSEVRHAAHHGLGNVLFEIGWQRLSKGRAYPGIDDSDPAAGLGRAAQAMRRLFDALLGLDREEEAPTDGLADFEAMVKRRLGEWMREPGAADTPARGAERFNDLLTDWIDAVKHYDAAPGVPQAAHNRALAVRYLKRLREILEQVEESAQSMQAVPQPGQGEPDPNAEPRDGQGGEDQENQNGQGGDDEHEPKDDGDKPDDQGDEDQEGPPQEAPKDDEVSMEPKPGETPEEAARRILGENADTQKGALSPGRVRYRRPDKDW